MIRKLFDNKLLKNTSYSFIGKIVAMIFLVLLDVTAARMLPVESYAEWVFFFAILTMLFYVGWMGINTSAKVYVSKTRNIRDRDNCLRASFVLRIVANIIICILVFWLAPKMAEFLGYPNKYANLKWLLQLAAILVFFNSFTELYKELCVGLQAYKSLFWVTVCEYGGYLVFSVVLLFLNQKATSIAIGYILSGMCILVLGLYLLNKNVGFSFQNTDSAYKEYLKPILKYALPIAVISFGGLILVEMDTFMLGLMSSEVEVATYSIAKNLCSKATHVNYALAVGTLTTFSVLTVENVVEKKARFRKINLVNVSITLGVALTMLIFGAIAIEIFYGEEYKAAGIVLRLLIPYYTLYSISNFYSSFLDFCGKARFRSICYISIIVINLTLNYLLIPTYGAKGAVIATDISLVPYTVFVAFGSFFEFHKLEKQKF